MTKHEESIDNYDCKVTIWFLSPKGNRIQAQRTQYNEFVENELENQALINWITIIVDPDDTKVKVDWFYPKKIVICTIRRDQFLYISLLNLVTSPVLVPTIFFSYFSYPFPSWSSSHFILSSFFYFDPPRVDQVADVDPCSISTFLKYLGVAVRLKITVQVSLPH